MSCCGMYHEIVRMWNLKGRGVAIGCGGRGVWNGYVKRRRRRRKRRRRRRGRE